MSAPKHLWSGDWETESRGPAPSLPPLGEPTPKAAATPDPAPRAAFSRRQLAIALSAGLVAAAVTVALALTLGGASKHPAHRPSVTASSRPAAPSAPKGSGGQGLTSPGASCAPGSAASSSTSACTTSPPAPAGPTADWMGMQIVTSPSGVVVSTVRLGSPADQAGVEPGDQIESIDGHLVGSVTELRPDTNDVRIGGPVTIGIMRASVQLSLASIPMTQRPAIHP